MEEADLTRAQQPVALVDGTIEEGLARPRHFDHPTGVLHHRLKHP